MVFQRCVDSAKLLADVFFFGIGAAGQRHVDPKVFEGRVGGERGQVLPPQVQATSGYQRHGAEVVASGLTFEHTHLHA
eukprot:1397774-Rhodomonas_salina.3